MSIRNKNVMHVINYAEVLKLFQDHIIYISFYTANAQLTANLIRLTNLS